jgi:hypothetical protein
MTVNTFAYPFYLPRKKKVHLITFLSKGTGFLPEDARIPG